MNTFIMQLNNALKDFDTSWLSRAHSTSPFRTVKCRDNRTDHNDFQAGVAESEPESESESESTGVVGTSQESESKSEPIKLPRLRLRNVLFESVI